MQEPQRKSPKNETSLFLNKLQSLTVEQRAYAFIVMMGVLGAIFGGLTTEIELRGCMQAEDCLLINPTPQRLKGIEIGALAGMSAAVILSLPTVLRS